MEKETLEEASGDDKKIEDYYLGKTLKIKRNLSSKHYEIFLKKSETIKIDKFVDGEVEGCRVAVGYKYGYEFLLFNITHAESYLQVCFELIDEPTITQEESKQETLEESKKYAELSYYGDEVDAFVRGAKWQAERMYSEEEVRELLIRALTHNDYNFCGALVTAQHEIRTANFGVWFENFKKK